MQLEQGHIHTWKDLAKEFLKHYRYNLNVAPSRIHLQNLTHESIESLKEYTKRWRELVDCGQPPMLDRDLNDVFMGTL